MTSSFNYSFTHAFNPLPLTSTFLFHDLSDWQLQILPRPQLNAHTLTQTHTLAKNYQLSITVFNSSCKWWLVTRNVMVLYWDFNGGFNLRNMMKICQKKQVNNYPFYSPLEENFKLMLHWSLILNGWMGCYSEFQECEIISCLVFWPPLCISHPHLFPVPCSPPSPWNYCFLLRVLFVCSPCLPLCPLFVVGNISPGLGNDHI